MLGIIDWGIGGIGVHKLIKERRPEISAVYISDTGATPYGKMSRAELVARLALIIRFLKSKGVTHLVIGCNAASTAIPFLDPQGLKIEGVIDAAVEMTARLKPKRLALIGGRRTVVSGVYRKAFARRGIEVEQRIAQPLSGLIESGDTSSEKLRGECSRILSPIRSCSHILLACTHYPAISEVIREYVSATTVLIDPAAALAAKASKWKLPCNGYDLFFTTGDAGQMKASALAAFKCDIGRVRIVNLDDVK
ncbi:MAG TPA: aspartate/glutamate racemase family protein [Pyrinomonadaceae bacterium]|nr:aspartate/glutamate racemase family protein [Pyrinomonadaceae bacterium]